MEKLPGLHIVGKIMLPGDFVPCSPDRCVQRCIDIVRANGLTYCTHATHKFGGKAFTAAIVLGESHVTLHTWYENGYVDVDVFVCCETRDNREAARKVFGDIVAFYRGTVTNHQEIDR